MTCKLQQYKADLTLNMFKMKFDKKKKYYELKPCRMIKQSISRRIMLKLNKTDISSKHLYKHAEVSGDLFFRYFAQKYLFPMI